MLGITFLPDHWTAIPPARRRLLLAGLEDAGVDHMVVPDHLTFKGGWGCDGMVAAADVLASSDRIGAYINVYLLGLRHPVPVARQIATLAQYHPGRLVVGVGVGGDDRPEVVAAGVDPATRGRRTDEALAVVRRLLSGEAVSHEGEFFSLDGVRVLPAPSTPVPFIVGGRADAALRRAGRLGDGYVGLWASPERFAEAVDQVAGHALAAGRDAVDWQHAMTLWCGFGPTEAEARRHAATALEGLYGIPFETFERWVPCGPPQSVAERVAAYHDAGAGTVVLVPHAGSVEAGVDAVCELAELLAKKGSPTCQV
jgi:alkanesulfonate monooxygenase SsuD/methylene tetrahydromethanopterin reductase-like flavin-dependent oxidoreductase (luciferase family)